MVLVTAPSASCTDVTLPVIHAQSMQLEPVPLDDRGGCVRIEATTQEDYRIHLVIW